MTASSKSNPNPLSILLERALDNIERAGVTSPLSSLLDDAIDLVNEAQKKYNIKDEFIYKETLEELHHTKGKEAHLIPMHKKMKDKQQDLRSLKNAVSPLLHSVITDLKKKEE